MKNKSKTKTLKDIHWFGGECKYDISSKSSSIYKYDEGNYIIYIHPLGVPFSLRVSLSSGLFVGSVLKINHKVYHFHNLKKRKMNPNNLSFVTALSFHFTDCDSSPTRGCVKKEFILFKKITERFCSHFHICGLH